MSPSRSYNDLLADAARVAGLLGIRAESLGDLSRHIERGLPKSALIRVSRRVTSSKGDTNQLLVKVVPEGTFKRRARLSPRESERTERLARVIASAEYVWESREDARQWLTTPHPQFEDRTPLDAAMTELGARRAEIILEKLFYGLPA